MNSRLFPSSITLGILLAGGLALPASASLVANGGFESGLASWSRLEQVGSDGTFSIQTGTSSPVNGFPVPPPPGGSSAAMSDSVAPGSRVLYQDFAVPASVPVATISFSLFVQNLADGFYVQPTLDFDLQVVNQQARVDVLKIGTDEFSVAAGDVLMNLYQTEVGDDLLSGYTPYAIDVTALFQAHAGGTLRLRFAQVDNLNAFNLGVDDVSVTVGTSVVPEASTWIAMPAIVGLVAAGYRRRAARRVRG